MLYKEVRPTNVFKTVEYVHLHEGGKMRITLKDLDMRDVKPYNLISLMVL